MDALKRKFHLLLFFIFLGLLAWSAYSVFTKLGGITAPDLTASAPIKVPELPSDELNATMAKLSDRYAMTAPTNVVMTSEERFNCSHCGKLTRYYHNVKNIECSHCGEKVNPDRPDRDNDTMPNEYEEEHGLDPNDPADAYEDKDGDFFNNIIEFQQDPQTSPSDPASHPPYTPFLFLTNFVNQPVPMLFKSKSKISAEKYSFMLRVPGNKTKIVKLGQDLGNYTIDGFEEIIEPSKQVVGPDGRTRTVPKRDLSVLKVKKKSNGRIFDLVHGSKKVATDRVATIKSVLEPEFSAKIDEFGNKSFQYRDEHYEVVELSNDGATLRRLSKEEGQEGEEVTVLTYPQSVDPNQMTPVGGFQEGFGPDNPDGFLEYPPGYVPPAPQRPGVAPRQEFPPGYFGPRGTTPRNMRPGAAPRNPGAYPGGIPPAPTRPRSSSQGFAPSAEQELRRQTEEYNRLKRSGALGL